MPRVRVRWIFVAVVFFSVFKEEITADVPDLPQGLTQIDAENLDGHVELSTLDVLPTTTPEHEHSTTHKTRKFLTWPSRRPAFKNHNERDSTRKTNELSSMAARQESYPKEMDLTTEIQEQTTQSAKTQTTKSHNRGSYRYVPPKSSVTRVSSSTTTTEIPAYTKAAIKAYSEEKANVTPKFRKFLMSKKLEGHSHLRENVKNETSSGLPLSSLGLKLETGEKSGIVTGRVEVSSKHQENLLKKRDEVVEFTKALLESEQTDHEKFFIETGTEMDETLFESSDPAESDLFEIDQNYNKFLTTEKPLEKVTVLLPASFNVKDVEANHDLEEVALISLDSQQPYKKENEKVEGITITTMKYVDGIFNFEATGTTANPVDEILIKNSTDATTTTEHDKLSHLNKFHTPRYHPRPYFWDHVNENSTKYLDRITTEYTTIQSNTEPKEFATIQPTENSFVDTSKTKHKVPYMHKHLNLKHAESSKTHLAKSVEEEPTENHVTTKHNKTLYMHQLANETSKGSFTNQLRESSLNGNSTEHSRIIHMHRLPHMKPKIPTITPLTENSINWTSSDANKKLGTYDLEDVTISSDIQHQKENENKEVEGITITTTKYIESLNFKSPDTTTNPVDELLVDNSTDATSTTTTTEHKLSNLNKFHISRYHPMARFGHNVNKNSTKYSDTTTKEYTTIQNNAEPEKSATVPPMENSFADTTKTKHQLTYMHKHLNLNHENSSTIVEEKPTVPSEQPQIIHMQRLLHMKPKNHTTTPIFANSINGTSLDVNKNLTAHIIVRIPKYPNLNHNSFNSSHLIENSAIENATDANTITEQDKVFPVHRTLNIKQKNFTKTHHSERGFNESSANANTTKTEHKSIHMHKYLNIKLKNATTSHYSESNGNETSEDENTVATHKIIHMPRLLNITPKFISKSHIIGHGLNESSVDEITTSPEHKIIHMQKNLNMKLNNSTATHPSKQRVFEKSADGDTREQHEIIDTQNLHTKPKSSTTHFTEKSDNENPIDENIAQKAHKVIHMHKILNPKLKNFTNTLITDKNEIDHDKMNHMNQLLDIISTTHPEESSVNEISTVANIDTTPDSKVIRMQHLNEKPKKSSDSHIENTLSTAHKGNSTRNPQNNEGFTIIEATEVVGNGETIANKYFEISESTSILYSSQDTTSSPVLPENIEEPQMSHIIHNVYDSASNPVRFEETTRTMPESIHTISLPENIEEPQMSHIIHNVYDSASNPVRIEETTRTMPESIHTISSTQIAQYPITPAEIILSTSQIKTTQTPDYTIPTVEEVTDENIDRLQHHENTHVHQTLEVTSTASTDISSEALKEVKTRSEFSSVTHGKSSPPSITTHYIYEEITTSPDISAETDDLSEFPKGTSKPIFSTETPKSLVPSPTTLEGEIIASTQYIHEEITTGPEVSIDAQIPSKVLTETAATSTFSHTTIVREITSTPQYIDKRNTTTLGANVSTNTDISTKLLTNSSTAHLVSSIRTWTEDTVTSVPQLQQVNSKKLNIPKRQYLLKRTTTTSPITPDQESGQEETATESIVTSAIIHLHQIHNKTTLSLDPSTLTETATYEAPNVKNENITSELYSGDASTETSYSITEIVNESNDLAENSAERIVTLSPAHWYGVSIDITTEVSADKKDIGKVINADIEGEQTVIDLHSVGTEQIELLAKNEGKLGDTFKYTETQELVTVDPAHWYGVEHGIENSVRAEVALENTIVINKGNETKTEQNITVEHTSGSMIEIGSRFGGTVSFTNETNVSASISNNAERDMNDNTTKETTSTEATLIIQNETTMGESLLINKTADKTDESRYTMQSGFKKNYSDHQGLHESTTIETTNAANISTIINNINQTIISGLNDKIESSTKKSPSLSSDVTREHNNVSTSSPNALLAENYTDLPKLADEVTITSSITSKNETFSSDNAVSELSKTGDKLTVFTKESKLLGSNSSKMETENEKPVEINTVHLEVTPEKNVTKLKDDAVITNTAPEGSTNSIPVTETVELVSENGQSSDVTLKNIIKGTEGNEIELGTEQNKMLFQKLDEVFPLNEDLLNKSESASFNNFFNVSGLDEKMVDNDDETEEDGDGESEYMDLNAIDRENHKVQDVHEEKIEDDDETEDGDGGSEYIDLYAMDRENHKVQDVHEVSYVERNILGNAANFSVEVKMKQQTIHMPSDVHITEDPKHLVLNFTWPTSENTYNYSLSLHLNESAGRYLINKMHMSFVKDNLTQKESNEHQEKDDSFVDLEDIQVIFSNTDFLKISKHKEEENSADLQRATKERQARVLHMEIILGAVVVIGVIVLVIYILLSRRRKLKSPINEDKDMSSRL